MALRADKTAEVVGLRERAGHEPRWSVNRAPSRWWPRVDVRELIAYRELAVTFAVRNLKVRYKQTFFGVAWVVLQPLLAVAIFTVVFGRVAHLSTGGTPYPVFVFAGMALWLYFSSSLTAAAQTFVADSDLVTKVFFPRLLAPLAAVASPVLDLLISLVILAVFVAAYRIRPGLQLALLPLWIIATVLFSLACGLWLSALNVKYRDVRYVLPFLIQIWFFASPVVYSGAILGGAWRWVFALNPLVALIAGFRWSLAAGPGLGLEAVVSLAIGVIVLAGGLLFFYKLEQFFGDLI